MGKKTKRTRWRALTLNGHQSDSEESYSKSANGYNHQRKFFYSSHSSPVRKFPNDASIKTTRSNSTTSEQKTTFNEDEYTRITTPRQDVLFKKGYLNKPKPYQTQTSTGTCSTANSTSTCTPDHQSADGAEGTDLDYESQLVFPNGFIDHNGIYYINSFEPLPFVVYNAPICYTEYTKVKRYSTDSMTESVSPQNEESGVTNASTQPSDEPSTSEEPRRQKKRRRRKMSRSKSITSEESTDSSDVFKTEEDAAKVNEAQSLLLQSLTKTYSLKPDAEEFIPRNLRAPETFAFDPNVQFVNIHPNFIPVPFIGDLQRQSLVPLNFIPPDAKLYPTYINVIPNNEYADVPSIEEPKEVETKKKNDIDIAKIVLKLEEAAKQQKFNENTKRQGYNNSSNSNNNNKNRGNFTRQRFSRYRNERAKISEVVDEKPPLEQPVWGPKKPIDVGCSRVSSKDCSNTQRIIKRTKTNVVQEKKAEIKVVPSPVRTPHKPNQWISVSSRRRRKNKENSVEVHEEDEKEEEIAQNDDLFESFDVNLLVDVVPPLKEPEQTPSETPTTAATTITVVEQPPPLVETTPPKKEDTQLDEKANETQQIKQKKKKKVQKMPIKKVMVIDQPLPQKIKPEELSLPLPPPPSPPPSLSPVTTTVEVLPEKVEVKTPEKKKKKKKKVPVLEKIQSMSSSNTTLNGEDSYDFLIENSTLQEFEFKTNVELSQELDRMIQKGMYSHLEEKIKSLNIGSNDDDFFKTVVKEKSWEESQPSTSKLGFYAWNSQEFQDKGEDYQNSSINLKTSQNFSVPTETILKVSPSQYPITQAVKEWMTKTRENTPDVEILKSPNTIYKEFYESDTSDSKSEDDVTVWSVSSNVDKDHDDTAPPQSDQIEECEEAVEVYESNYGKNEDYLKIKNEIDAHYNNRDFPRRGDLPYRAICCNVM